MPSSWEPIKLNDGRKIPSIGFGTWKIPQSECAEQVEQALDTSFIHIDTAQGYQNEQQVGEAIQNKDVDRSTLWITTKHSRPNGLQSISDSLDESLDFMKVDYVDLYLLHNIRVAEPDIPTAWKMMEDLRNSGKAKSIGVSNFGIGHLTLLLASAKVKPAVNQIEFHPEVLASQLPIHEFGTKNGIVTEAYSLLIPITQNPSGKVAKTVNEIANRLDLTSDQVLMSWAKSKGVVVVTTSSKKSRLEGYQEAGRIQLSDEDILKIDVSGALDRRYRIATTALKRTAGVVLTLAAVLRLGVYLGLL